MDTTTTTTMEPSELPAIDTPRRPRIELFLISFLILFFELACIRWFGSTVVFLTFFTNVVLLACFLGMSVGLLTASRRKNYIRWVLPLTFFSIAVAMVSYNLYIQYWQKITIAVGNQTASPGLIYFGTEYRPPDPSRLVIPVWSIAGAFFLLITLIFVGLGQTMGRAFDAISNRVSAYTFDVLGSLTGIAAFGAMSYYQLSPHYWFFVIVIVVAYFVRRWTYIQIFSAVGIVFLMGISAFGGNVAERIFWSPYYKVAYDFKKASIDTNKISHQQMVDITKNGPGYMMPHLINRDAGGAPFENVLIIGAGSGNDVSAALHFETTKRVDAVEIVPQINLIGRDDHPNHPYQDPRVKDTIHWTDGRRFASRPVIDPKTGQEVKYDLAVYALVDSLVLHSGYSSLRLENFLFTEQAFKDIKSRLKPGGVFAMYNYYRQGWVVGRLYLLAKKVFGTEPVVISMDYMPEIHPSDNLSDTSKDKVARRTFLLVGTDSARLAAIKKKFEENKNFWINPDVAQSEARNGYSAEPPAATDDWLKISPSKVFTDGITDRELPTDDWPQLYLKEHAIPKAPTQQGMITIAVLSVLVLLVFGWPVWFGKQRVGSRSNGRMFFLGAGFMLLETKGVVHMALLFGSTWTVNSVVFFAILVMILIANLFTMAIEPQKLWPYYLLLLASLVVNGMVEMDWFLGLPNEWRVLASVRVVFLPVFFAGVIFATSFRDSKNPDVDFGSNVAGIILGGLSEQLSLIIGFKALMAVAIGYYVLSALFMRKQLALPSPDDAMKPPAEPMVAPAAMASVG